MESVGTGRRRSGIIGLLAQASWRGLTALDARLVSFFFDPPVKTDGCPDCGGTDLFDGRGTCQICQPM